MIQRKQSIFLLLAAIAYIVCLFLPIANVDPKAMEGQTEIFNLGIVTSDGNMSIVGMCVPLFIILSITTILSFVTIFMYKNRKLQLNLCSITMFLNMIWYIGLALVAFGVISIPDVNSEDLSINFASCLPLVSFILIVMARKGISDDEKLVRAADRIR